MYIPTKNDFRKKDYKVMYKGSNWDRKSQLSEILTEPLNPRELGERFYLYSFTRFIMFLADISS